MKIDKATLTASKYPPQPENRVSLVDWLTRVLWALKEENADGEETQTSDSASWDIDRLGKAWRALQERAFTAERQCTDLRTALGIERLNAQLFPNPWATPRWIPCAERLPEVAVAVIAYGCQSGVLAPARIDARGRWFNASTWDRGHTSLYHAGHCVSHWMPLPKAPGE